MSSSTQQQQQTKMNPDDWRWTSSSFTRDQTQILVEYPERVTLAEVHEKLERQFPDRTWDWTVDEKSRTATVFKNHWRVKEDLDLARGKTQEQIWQEEAIGKCLRMANMMRKHNAECRNLDGSLDLTYGVENTKQCWIANKTRRGVLGRPPMSEEDARAEVEKAFADYIAEYGEA